MTSSGTPRSRSSAWIAAGVLSVLLLILFHQSFQPGYVLFANDGPLGMLVAQADIVWTNFRAYWQDANWIGVAMPAGSPSISPLLYASLGPVAFAKFHGPLSLLILATIPRQRSLQKAMPKTGLSRKLPAAQGQASARVA